MKLYFAGNDGGSKKRAEFLYRTRDKVLISYADILNKKLTITFDLIKCGKNKIKKAQ